MHFPDNPALYIAIGVFILIALAGLRSPLIKRVASLAFWLGSIALVTVLVAEQGRFHPTIAAALERLQLDPQRVVGDDVRIRMSPDGHFWARARIGDLERRMLIDTGATVTAISPATAAAAGSAVRDGMTPVIVQTANGGAAGQTATIDRLTIGGITASDHAVVVSPTFGPIDVLGMNFLSQLESWRVEGKTMVLVPKSERQSSALPISMRS